MVVQPLIAAGFSCPGYLHVAPGAVVIGGWSIEWVSPADRHQGKTFVIPAQKVWHASTR